MKDNKVEMKSNAKSQILYNQPSISQINYIPRYAKPPKGNELNDRQVLR